MNNHTQALLDAIRKEDSVELRQLAGDFGDEAAITQNKEDVEFAIIAYCFHKIFLKTHFRDKHEEIVDSTLSHIEKREFESALSEIADFDRRHGMFYGNLVVKARIKIASRLYSRGISISQSASITGAKISDILAYVGETKEFHSHGEGKPLSVRLNVARDIFKKASDGE